MKFKVIFPITEVNGTYSTIVSDSYETKEQEALRDYNSCLAHDGNGPVDELPDGTRFVRIRESKPYQPKTGEKCHCKPEQYRDNCPDCEGTGWKIDFRAIHARKGAAA